MKMCFKMILGVIVIAIGFSSARASEKAINMKDLPAAVRRTVQEQSQGAVIRRLSKEIEGGKTVYEVEMKVKGHGKDVTMDASGEVIEVEEEVPLESLPNAARAAIEKAAGRGQITKVERVSGGKQAAYEAHVRRDGKTSEIKIGDDGRFLPAD
jgi:uncharacterized membrane protein YkoI